MEHSLPCALHHPRARCCLPQDSLPENSVKALEMLENMFNWLITFSESNASSSAEEAEKAKNVAAVADLYLALLNAVAKVSLEPNKYLRNHAIVILQRSVTRRGPLICAMVVFL